MRTLIVALAIIAAAPVAAQSYSECETIVAQHTFMLESRKGCNIKLRKDTSDLAYKCSARLSEIHREVAMSSGRKVAEVYRDEKQGERCSALKDDFYPLIED